MLAGPNGAGKSTFYYTLVDKGFRTGVFVNTDVIASRMQLQGKISEHLIDFHAGRETLGIVAGFIKNRTDFTRESTLSGQEILRSINNAKAAAFETNLVYVGLEHVNLSIQRVAARVESGGHDIPLDAIRRRYEKSIRNLVKACHIADNVIFFDNSSNDGYSPLAQIISGRLSWLSYEQPSWLKKVLKEWTPAV